MHCTRASIASIERTIVADPKSRVRINYAAPTLPPHGIDPDTQEGLRFNGSAYAAFTAPDSIYLETNITLEFKFDRAQDGLLLFAGQWEGKDFLAVSLIGGNIILRLTMMKSVAMKGTQIGDGNFQIRLRRGYGGGRLQRPLRSEQMAHAKHIEEILLAYSSLDKRRKESTSRRCC